MISIAGPMTIAHKALITATNTKNTVVASYLAQDAIEYIKNIKDHNILLNPEQNNWLDGIFKCSSTSPCKVDTINNTTKTDDPDAYGISTCGSGTSCQLYIGPDGYSHSSNGTKPSIFSRYFYITQNPINLDDQATLTVVVKWDNGYAESVKYETQIFKVIE